LGRRELSLLLLQAMFAQAGLDPFESADVFHRVAALRPAFDLDATRLEDLAGQLRPLFALTGADVEARLADCETLAAGSDWLAAFGRAGTLLEQAVAGGELDRGLRAILAHIVIFHWNRLGLTASTQAILARAASASALLAD
jgi:thiopeptide-type bacteriocin biosynthesis protein